MARKSQVITQAAGNIAAGAVIAYFNPQKEEVYKKALPKEVVHFIEYNCAANYAYVHVYAAYRKLGSKEKLIKWLKDASRREMVRAFGESHPCAAN